MGGSFTGLTVMETVASLLVASPSLAVKENASFPLNSGLGV